MMKNKKKKLRKAKTKKKFFTGIMPIRVLQNTLIHAFENMNPGFLDLAKSVMKDQGLDPEISYSIEKNQAKSPYVLFNKIFLNESFLSYIWCISFSLTVLYSEVVVKKSRNDYYGNNNEIINAILSRDAYKLWEYAITILNQYKEWDLQLPNPEVYKFKKKDLIERINGLYITAMMFVLAHEFAHIELEHNKKNSIDARQEEQNAKLEKEADERAIELVLNGIDNKNKTTREMGLLIGLCSLLFFDAVTKKRDYPDTDERIDALIRKLDPKDPKDALWGISTLAYKLWDKQYNKGLTWKEGLESPKALYHSIKDQVRQLS
jgi:hypothetical protein